MTSITFLLHCSGNPKKGTLLRTTMSTSKTEKIKSRLAVEPANWNQPFLNMINAPLSSTYNGVLSSLCTSTDLQPPLVVMGIISHQAFKYKFIVFCRTDEEPQQSQDNSNCFYLLQESKTYLELPRCWCWSGMFPSHSLSVLGGSPRYHTWSILLRDDRTLECCIPACPGKKFKDTV